MADNESAERVSREAHDRVVRERDELKSKLEELSGSLQDMAYEREARKVFAQKGVANPDWAAEMALPHLRSAQSLSEIPELIESERFAPIFQMGQMGTPVAADEDDDRNVPSENARRAPAGPNPGGRNVNGNAALPPVTREEYNAAIARDDMEQIQAWHKEGRLTFKTRALVGRGR